MHHIISITGTPGTGKTAVAKELAKNTGANMISINKLLKKKKIPCKIDKKRGTRIIDIHDLKKTVNKEIQNDKINIIDGHLSHFLKSDIVFVLRTEPKVLEKRMKRKGWSKSKILENIQAEIIDEITAEALEKHERNKIVEIDTSKTKPKKAAETILKILSNKQMQKKHSPGKVSWLKKYYKMLEK
jgi:adenylate kinase